MRNIARSYHQFGVRDAIQVSLLERTRPGSFRPAPKLASDWSVWTADLGGHAEPDSNFTFDVAAPAEFIPSVEVAASPDQKNWNIVGTGEIYRYSLGETVCQGLSFDVSNWDSPYRYWRFEILNHNESLLDGVKAHPYTIPRHVVFEQQPGHNYSLIYGQLRALVPEYDLSRRMNSAQMLSAAMIRLGPQEINTDWVDPRPLSEKHDFLLLGIAVVLIGYSALRSLRRSAPNNPARSE